MHQGVVIVAESWVGKLREKITLIYPMFTKKIVTEHMI